MVEGAAARTDRERLAWSPMKNFALLVAGMVAVVAVVGCSDGSVSTSASPQQSSDIETSPTGQSSGPIDGDGGADAGSPPAAESVDPAEVSGSPAPTVAAQEPGSPLLVAGAELAAPGEWQVSGVSSGDGSEVVNATSDDGQFISLRSVRTDATVEEQIAQALEADAEQTVEAPDVEADGETLRGVETALTASGGEAIQLRYFVRRGDSLITIDIVTTAEQQQALLEQLGSGLMWR